MKTLVSTILLCAGLFIFQSCQNESTQTSSDSEDTVHSLGIKPNIPTIAPPLEKVNVPYHKMTVQAETGGELTLDNGTTIQIPEDAFVGKDGQPITGEVEIAYREFHNAAEIIASGIPMTDETGQKYMQTAGMFEINGSHEGASIEIAEGKALDVKMASFVEDGQNYDFFLFDEEQGQWQTQGTAAPQQNTAKIEKLKKLPQLPTQPVKPEAASTENIPFEFNVNYKKFPELRAYEGVAWEYTGKDPKNNPDENEWVFEEDWADINLEQAGNGRYKIVLESYNKYFKMEVKPVLSGEDLQNAMAEFEKRQEKYLEVREARKQEEERLAQEADFLRSFQVQQFGVFNWDVWKDPERLAMKAKFDFGQDAYDFNKIAVFLITADKRSVVRYYPTDFDKFSFDPNDNNELVAILPGNKMATFSKEDFKNIDITALENATEPSYTFKMRIEDQPIQSMGQLEDALAMK